MYKKGIKSTEYHQHRLALHPLDSLTYPHNSTLNQKYIILFVKPNDPTILFSYNELTIPCILFILCFVFIALFIWFVFPGYFIAVADCILIFYNRTSNTFEQLLDGKINRDN